MNVPFQQESDGEGKLYRQKRHHPNAAFRAINKDDGATIHARRMHRARARKSGRRSGPMKLLARLVLLATGLRPRTT
jgi:hypothetical protein